MTDEDDQDEEAAVIDLTDHATADEEPPEVDDEADVEEPDDQEMPAPEPEAGSDDLEPKATDEPVFPEPFAARGDLEPVPSPPETAPVSFANDGPSAKAPVGPDGYARIESVAVAEGRDGIVITVTSSDGRAERQIAASTEGGVETAVVRATAKLALPVAPEASVVEIEDRRVAGTDIVMIVLDVDGHMAAGSSVVHAGRPFALGRATWAALTL